MVAHARMHCLHEYLYIYILQTNIICSYVVCVDVDLFVPAQNKASNKPKKSWGPDGVSGTRALGPFGAPDSAVGQLGLAEQLASL